jgi:membrane fusion protein (multidrug efflux system)
MNDTAVRPTDVPTIAPMNRTSATNRLRSIVHGLRRRLLLWVGAPVAAALVVGGAAYYWSIERFVVSTDDAYVQADSTTVQAAVDDLQAQLVEQSTLIERAKAGVAASQAALDLANLNRVRYRKMAGIGFGSQQQSQEADAQAAERSADLARDRAALNSARDQVQVLKAKLAQAQALHDRSQAVEQRALLELGYTTIVAPIDGVVAARTVRLGQYVQAGTQLTALVPLRAVYVMANFKETQLTHVRAGQPVRVRVDTFPGVALQACVDSLAPASGLEFSLLPPDNATGNFTKIVQRVPVKIRFDSGQPLSGELRPGMSVEASVDTNPARAQETCPAQRL